MAEIYKETELQKLKVAQLKKLLEENGLPTTGNKPELVSRLSAIGGSQGGLNVSDRDILEDDSILDESSSVNLTVSNGKMSPVSSVPQPSSGVITVVTAAPSSGTAAKQAASSSNKLESRLKRFGVVSEQARKAARSERFQSSSNSSVVPDSTNFKVTPNEDAIKKRAERFGLVSNNTSEQTLSVDQLKKRAERFGQVTSSSLSKVELEERLLKRKARFISGGGSSEEPKIKRMQRFGTVTAP